MAQFQENLSADDGGKGFGEMSHQMAEVLSSLDHAVSSTSVEGRRIALLEATVTKLNKRLDRLEALSNQLRYNLRNAR